MSKLLMLAAATVIVAACGQPLPRITAVPPIARAMPTLATEPESAIVQEGPHRGELLDLDCSDSLYTFEVGRGIVCRPRVTIPTSESSWRYEVLKDVPVNLTSSDTSVVVTARGGLVVAKKAGYARLTGHVLGARPLANVRVYPAVASLHWEPSRDTTLRLGDTLRLHLVQRGIDQRDSLLKASASGWALWGAKGPVVQSDTLDAGMTIRLRAISPGRITIYGRAGARTTQISITVPDDSAERAAAKVIAQRRADSAAALSRKRAPAVGVLVVDRATGKPVENSRVELGAAATSTQRDGMVQFAKVMTGSLRLVVRCPWKRPAPAADERTLQIIPTTDIQLTIPISGDGCIDEPASRKVAGVFQGWFQPIPNTMGGLFLPCGGAMDSLPVLPGLQTRAAFASLVDSAMMQRSRLQQPYLDAGLGATANRGQSWYVEWTGTLVGPDVLFQAPTASYQLMVRSIAVYRPGLVTDCHP